MACGHMRWPCSAQVAGSRWHRKHSAMMALVGDNPGNRPAQGQAAPWATGEGAGWEGRPGWPHPKAAAAAGCTAWDRPAARGLAEVSAAPAPALPQGPHAVLSQGCHTSTDTASIARVFLPALLILQPLAWDPPREPSAGPFFSRRLPPVPRQALRVHSAPPRRLAGLAGRGLPAEGPGLPRCPVPLGTGLAQAPACWDHGLCAKHFVRRSNFSSGVCELPLGPAPAPSVTPTPGGRTQLVLGLFIPMALIPHPG
ncbi:uncharacterized protein LOC131378687 [Hirundo rustica]|uniref:uncharacterized protein LOC131378687 n=1 Tax=Hirundo rustica TaxID=43150 RepID=UPI002672F17A|nr:uncharacterized protein LOC131378687 [Hirundo rustica]